DFTTNDCTLTVSTTCGPLGIAFDNNGNLWMTDTGNHRVLEFKPPFSNGMEASLVIGQPDFTSNTSPNPTASSLWFPYGIAFDSHGNVFVGDDGNCRVLEYQPPFSNGMSASLVLGQMNFTTNICVSFPNPPTQNGLANAYGMRFDSAGNLWVADYGNSRVL